MGLPVHVVDHIKCVILTAIIFSRIGPPVKNAKLPAISLIYRTPGIFTMIRNIGTAAGSVVHDARLVFHMENAVPPAEGNQMPDKPVQIRIRLQKLPVKPGNLIILAICIIVARL